MTNWDVALDMEVTSLQNAQMAQRLARCQPRLDLVAGVRGELRRRRTGECRLRYQPREGEGDQAAMQSPAPVFEDPLNQLAMVAACSPDTDPWRRFAIRCGFGGFSHGALPAISI